MRSPSQFLRLCLLGALLLGTTGWHHDPDPKEVAAMMKCFLGSTSRFDLGLGIGLGAYLIWRRQNPRQVENTRRPRSQHNRPSSRCRILCEHSFMPRRSAKLRASDLRIGAGAWDESVIPLKWF